MWQAYMEVYDPEKFKINKEKKNQMSKDKMNKLDNMASRGSANEQKVAKALLDPGVACLNYILIHKLVPRRQTSP